MPDEDVMSGGDIPPRRWDDIVREVTVQVRDAVPQALVPYRITVEETARDVAQLKTVVFGSPALGVRGMVERMGAVEGKLDTLIDGQTRREEDWRAVRAFLDQESDRQVLLRSLKRTAEITRWVVVFLGSVIGVVVGLNALGVLHL